MINFIIWVQKLNKWKFALVWTLLINIIMLTTFFVIGLTNNYEHCKFAIVVVNLYLVLGPVASKFLGVNVMKNI